MRLLFGIILGFALTVGGVYLADQTSTRADARPMVNWDVVAKNVDQTHHDGARRLAPHQRLSAGALQRILFDAQRSRAACSAALSHFGPLRTRCIQRCAARSVAPMN